MLAFGYFLITLIAVLMSSTVGTVLLVRACLAGHLRRGWAVASILMLALGLPVAVPLAVAALFMQVIKLLPGGGTLSEVQAQHFMLALFGSVVAALVLSVFAGVSGIRKLPPRPGPAGN